ncbi:Lrp/AsnC family transcriptional regulator [Bacillus sp. TL12]|uniref:Lrp/AsnC family transcriptional regulator n=1 Tax=Bacillus sp. TL12 TaxID=2894756 RepID=UPI001F52A86E|nr:Lrp/AsnC family transcriptional regulator [Bacillus sp. TL12]MCI0768475.1 Lrp/AsnC family transcriptional regulator [Bacillus sp. TL12]
MVDYVDIKILSLLKENSRVQWKDIGKEIHMTGQAVGNRIRKMEEEGIIKAYTVLLDEMKLGKSYLAFITIFMKTNEHSRFLDFIVTRDSIVEAHKISGEGCYILKLVLESQEQLNSLLDEILIFGNYRLNLSVNKIKG